MRNQLTPTLVVWLAVGCGPTSSPGESSSDSATSGTATTHIDTIGASESDGSVPPLWESWFGIYTTSGAEVGMAINPQSFSLDLLDLRDDETLRIEQKSYFCISDGPPSRWDNRWVPDGDARIRLEGAEPGSPPNLWGDGIDEAWIEAGAEPGSLTLRYIEPDGEVGGGSIYRPGCLCVPDPAACCEMNCIDLVLQACAPDEVSVLCDEP